MTYDIFFYGSLMHPDELAAHGLRNNDLFPVKVAGLRRLFAQEPSWRKRSGRDRAILTVLREPDAQANGILVLGVTGDQMSLLTPREGGYFLDGFDAAPVRAYPGFPTDLPSTMHTFFGKSECRNDTLLPHPGYLDLCTRGARLWGNRFYGDFLATTFLADGRPLSAYVSPLQE